MSAGRRSPMAVPAGAPSTSVTELMYSQRVRRRTSVPARASGADAHAAVIVIVVPGGSEETVPGAMLPLEPAPPPMPAPTADPALPVPPVGCAAGLGLEIWPAHPSANAEFRVTRRQRRDPLRMVSFPTDSAQMSGDTRNSVEPTCSQ